MTHKEPFKPKHITKSKVKILAFCVVVSLMTLQNCSFIQLATKSAPCLFEHIFITSFCYILHITYPLDLTFGHCFGLEILVEWKVFCSMPGYPYFFSQENGPLQHSNVGLLTRHKTSHAEHVWNKKTMSIPGLSSSNWSSWPSVQGRLTEVTLEATSSASWLHHLHSQFFCC